MFVSATARLDVRSTSNFREGPKCNPSAAQGNGDFTVGHLIVHRCETVVVHQHQVSHSFMLRFGVRMIGARLAYVRFCEYNLSIPCLVT